jgi:hypothetical protein
LGEVLLEAGALVDFLPPSYGRPVIKPSQEEVKRMKISTLKVVPAVSIGKAA